MATTHIYIYAKCGVKSPSDSSLVVVVLNLIKEFWENVRTKRGIYRLIFLWLCLAIFYGRINERVKWLFLLVIKHISGSLEVQNYEISTFQILYLP